MNFNVNQPSDINSAKGVFEFIRGFINGTKIISTPSLGTCENSFNKVYDNSVAMGNGFGKKNAKVVDYLNTLDILYDIMYKSDSLLNDCYNGAFEAGNTASNYGKMSKDPQYIAYNLVFNFGQMYNSIKDVALYFKGDPKAKATSAFNAGLELGKFVYLCLYDEN